MSNRTKKISSKLTRRVFRLSSPAFRRRVPWPISAFSNFSYSAPWPNSTSLLYNLYKFNLIGTNSRAEMNQDLMRPSWHPSRDHSRQHWSVYVSTGQENGRLGGSTIKVWTRESFVTQNVKSTITTRWQWLGRKTTSKETKEHAPRICTQQRCKQNKTESHIWKVSSI